MRNLEREIGAVCRKVVTTIAEEKARQTWRSRPRRCASSSGGRTSLATKRSPCAPAIPGVATGLAYTPVGGDVLFIEATRMPGGKGFQVTGSVGNVMQESARAALSYVRSRAETLGLDRISSINPISTCTSRPARSPKMAHRPV